MANFTFLYVWTLNIVTLVNRQSLNLYCNVFPSESFYFDTVVMFALKTETLTLIKYLNVALLSFEKQTIYQNQNIF